MRKGGKRNTHEPISEPDRRIVDRRLPVRSPALGPRPGTAQSNFGLKSHGPFASCRCRGHGPPFCCLLRLIRPTRSGRLKACAGILSALPAATPVVAAALLGSATGWLACSQFIASQQEFDTSRWLLQVDRQLAREVEQLWRANQAVELLIEQADGRFSPAELQRWAPRLLQGRAPRTALSLAPQGTLTAIVPAPPTTEWRGVNLLSHPRYSTSSLRSVRNRSVVLQGPVPLLQGGLGLIVRTPVFVGPQGRFWGFVSGLGPWSTWMTSLERQAERHHFPMAVGVEVRDSLNETFRTPDYSRIAATGVVGKTMAVPGGSITLAAVPTGLAPSHRALAVVAPLTGAVTGAGLSLLVGRRQRRHQLQRLEQELIRLQAMARYRALFEASLDVVTLINRDLQFIEANPAVVELYGVESVEAFLRLTPQEFSPELQPDGRPSAEVALERISEAFERGELEFEYLHQRLDTGETWLGLVSLRRIELEDEPVLMARVRDITSSRRYEQKIEELAYRDAITGLANRVATQEWLDQQLKVQPQQPLLVINLDLDDFRSLNLAFGQEKGDQLLRHVAGRLRLAFPDAAWLARLDSDEFLMILALPAGEAAGDGDQSMAWCHHLQQQLADAAADLASPMPRLSASAGCTLVDGPAEGLSALALMQQANTALQLAKQAGRGGIAVYSQALASAIQERLALEQELEQALTGGRADQAFQLVYQPQVNRAGRVVRAEALLRFQGDDGIAISPDRLIPLAERSGQIHPIGRWVLETAFRQQAQWREAGLTLVPLAVNVSARQFDDVIGIQPLLDQLLDLQKQYNLDPRNIILELTETALLRNFETLRQQSRQIVAAGFRIALDDFGSGYSSLTVLRDYPVSQVKIDKSFVEHINLDPSSCAIVKALVAITQARRMDLVAEGVETNQQLEALTHLGLQVFQGYLFAAGLSADDFAALLRDPDGLINSRGGRQAA